MLILFALQLVLYVLYMYYIIFFFVLRRILHIGVLLEYYGSHTYSSSFLMYVIPGTRYMFFFFFPPPGRLLFALFGGLGLFVGAMSLSRHTIRNERYPVEALVGLIDTDQKKRRARSVLGKARGLQAEYHVLPSCPTLACLTASCG